MKKAFLYFIISVCVSSIFSACKKGSDNISFSPTPDFTASINESAFQQTSLIAEYNKSAGSKLEIKATEATTKRIIYLQISNYAGLTGTYNIDSAGTMAEAYYQDTTTTYNGKVGNIILYNITPGLVQGTFTFSMKDATKLKDIQVTGKFTVAPLQ